MPKHFILGFEDESVINGDPIKFYINPFSNGTILNRQDLELFLKREQLKEESKYFTSCGNEAIIKRLINNLLHSYIFQGKKRKSPRNGDITQTFQIIKSIYLAKLTALVSLITVTLTCPGYVISVSIFCDISKDNFSASVSDTFSLSTITLNSLPACIA